MVAPPPSSKRKRMSPGLITPSREAVVALEPDLVVVVPSLQQRDFRSRLREFEVEVLELANLTLDQILESMQTLGDRIGRSQAAREHVAAIRSTWIDVARDASLRGEGARAGGIARRHGHDAGFGHLSRRANQRHGRDARRSENSNAEGGCFAHDPVFVSRVAARGQARPRSPPVPVNGRIS